jgi:two-component system sensor histidine kinase KdpD
VVLVDLPPDDLLQRLKEGKVYLPQQAERAIRNFFRKGNLIALRELALRRTADRVDDEMLAYRRETSVATVWQTRDALLVCIGSGTGASDWCAPERAWQGDWRPPGTPFTSTRTPRDRSPRCNGSASSARSNYPLPSVLKRRRSRLTTRSLRLSTMLASRTCRACWSGATIRAPGDPGTVRWPTAIGQAAPDLDVVQVARNEDARAAVPPPTAPPTPGEWLAYLKAAAICAVATALATPLAGVIELTNIAMLFLLAVLIVAMRLGRGPAVASSFLAVAAFDFFFVAPRFSFAVSDAQYLMTFAVMLIVALITGQLTARYKQHADVATSARRAPAGFTKWHVICRQLLLPMQIAEACDRFLSVEFGAQAALLLTDAKDHLQAETSMPNRRRRAHADRRRGRRPLGLRSRRGGRTVHRHLAGQPAALPAAQGADAHARRARHRAA